MSGRAVVTSPARRAHVEAVVARARARVYAAGPPRRWWDREVQVGIWAAVLLAGEASVWRKLMGHGGAR